VNYVDLWGLSASDSASYSAEYLASIDSEGSSSTSGSGYGTPDISSATSGYDVYAGAEIIALGAAIAGGAAGAAIETVAAVAAGTATAGGIAAGAIATGGCLVVGVGILLIGVDLISGDGLDQTEAFIDHVMGRD